MLVVFENVTFWYIWKFEQTLNLGHAWGNANCLCRMTSDCLWGCRRALYFARNLAVFLSIRP